MAIPKFKQVVAAQWRDTYSLYGLDNYGQVWRYQIAQDRWQKCGSGGLTKATSVFENDHEWDPEDPWLDVPFD